MFSEKGSTPLEKLVASCRDHLSTEKKERERAFLENGSRVTEELVAFCNGKPSPIRRFSYEELRQATDSYDDGRVLTKIQIYKWYKGSFDGRSVCIKKYEKNTTGPNVFTEIAISAKMCAHKNVLKLVGCCLETQLPTLVYESAANGTLSDRIYIYKEDGVPQQRQPIAWRSRLKIAREIAHAIAYLHTGFSRPIIHRDIRLGNIFLDQHDVPKLTEFSLSLSVPEGETHVDLAEDEVRGTFGFLCPRCFATGRVTEKTDVYSFGMLLLVLLTGQRTHNPRATTDEDADLISYIKHHAISQIVDHAIWAREREAGVDLQLQAMLQLGLVCSDLDPKMRPTMVDVTKELRRIERFV